MERPLAGELRWLLRIFAALALVAGVLLFVLSEETGDWFAWTIQPPLTAAFLGAAYWAAFVLIAWTARQREWRYAPAALAPVGVIAILLLGATLIHEDRFHDDLFGWFWKAAYVLVPIALLAAVARQLRLPGRRTDTGAPLPTALRGLVGVQGIVMLGVGAGLFVAPESVDAIWPWDLTPLTARAIGAFIVGFGASALHALLVNDVARFAGAALAYATLGALELIALARYSDDLSGADLDSAVYVAFLGSVVVVGGYGVRVARRRVG